MLQTVSCGQAGISLQSCNKHKMCVQKQSSFSVFAKGMVSGNFRLMGEEGEVPPPPPPFSWSLQLTKQISQHFKNQFNCGVPIDQAEYKSKFN